MKAFIKRTFFNLESHLISPLLSLSLVLFLSGCSSFNPESLYYSKTPPPQDLNKLTKKTHIAVMQGFTNATEAHFSVVANKDLKYQFQEKSQGALKELKPYEHITFRQWKILKLKATNLKPRVNYVLRLSTKEGHTLQERFFQALDPQKKNPKIIVGSCMHEGKFIKEQIPFWTDLLNHRPDVIFLIGDNVYVDSSYHLKRIGKTAVNPEWIFKRYIEARLHIPLFRSTQLYPVFATWDDHDFGINNGNRTFRYAKESRRIFHIFFPQGPLEKGPGVSSYWPAFGQNFIFLDNRSFRSPKKSKVQEHFGKTQEQWISQILKIHPEPSWLISGGQFFGGAYPWESYEADHPKAFLKFQKSLRNFPQPISFLSGDRHFSEIMKVESQRVGQDTYEITASPLHSFLYPNPWKSHPNKKKVVGISGVINYTVLEPKLAFNDTKDDPEGDLHIKVRAFTSEKKLLFEEDLVIEGKR